MNEDWMNQSEWQLEALIQASLADSVCERQVTEGSFIYSMLQAEIVRMYVCVNPLQMCSTMSKYIEGYI